MNEAIIDRIREAAEQAAAEGVVRGVNEALAQHGPEILWAEFTVVMAGILLAWAIIQVIRMTLWGK